jgi:C4-dicarboxylate transporter
VSGVRFLVHEIICLIPWLIGVVAAVGSSNASQPHFAGAIPLSAQHFTTIYLGSPYLHGQ